LTLKIYTKGERLLRIEVVVHNTQELRCGHSLEKFPRILTQAKGILERFMESTSSGLKAMVALVVLRNKAIKPLLAAAQRRRKSRGAQNPRPIDKHYETIRTAMQGVFDELGLAA
jgi:hypothetical protein